MSRVSEILRRYIADHRASGEMNPLPYLSGVKDAERVELAALIDHYLAEAPPSAFDQKQFDQFRKNPHRCALVEQLLVPSLEELRTRVPMTKQEVGNLLAAELDTPGHEQGFKARYHDLEAGRIASGRVAPEVWSALSRAFGQSVDYLRDAVEYARAEVTGPDEPVVFARGMSPNSEAEIPVAKERSSGLENSNSVDVAFFRASSKDF